MSTATLTPKAEELDARVRALLELEDIAAPDLVTALRRDRIRAELALAELLEDVAP